MDTETHLLAPISAHWYPAADTLNGPLAAAFARLSEQDFRQRSHCVDGRFENLYLDAGRLPGLTELLRFAGDTAAARLGLGAAKLRCGFWLNAMPPGSRTSRHSHEENDELLSGVYYVTAPAASGDLCFADGPFEVRVTPEPGLMLLFPPSLKHWVEPHRGAGLRLSVAFNFGNR
ncbi:putative 2OG-Fe(II) oxygenase [Thiohalocapsa sp. ML1]|uniref:putative 2OG-Fe(II) oxygenase n=1 Tax=Thiohalocapsa sp. ML1 TaxID=1431688 RepID=UPI0007323528|nr:putative 2OG-Fe(II) oxygenase [Thiohalocapsa sp. ML1]